LDLIEAETLLFPDFTEELKTLLAQEEFAIED